jgi:hypothetical protein
MYILPKAFYENDFIVFMPFSKKIQHKKIVNALILKVKPRFASGAKFLDFCVLWEYNSIR